MAYLIEIRKIDEDALSVKYHFEGGGFDIAQGSGLININKKTGDVEVIEHHGEHWERLYDKVMMKLAKHWETGQFPDKTSFAA